MPDINNLTPELHINVADKYLEQAEAAITTSRASDYANVAAAHYAAAQAKFAFRRSQRVFPYHLDGGGPI